jgi:hypothetical protein
LLQAPTSRRVVAWEPVPQFRAFLEYGLALNGFQSLVEVRAAAASDRAGANLSMQVPRRGIWGTASVGGGNIDRCRPGQWPSVVSLETRGCFLDRVRSDACAVLSGTV